MRKILLAGAVVVLAGIVATVATATEYKPLKPAGAPSHAVVVTPASSGHKGQAPKKHHAAKHHHAKAHKAHHAK